MTISIGVIAEDASDIAVVNQIIKKILPDRKYSIKSFVGHGCGKIRGKCCQWADVLHSKGCSRLLLLHDLDQSSLQQLRFQLEQRLLHCKITRNIVVIPIREIEAWLLSDTHAIQTAMNIQGKINSIPNPEGIDDPKRKLGEIIYLNSGKTKRYINTAHNWKIAAEIDISEVRKCSSFLPLERFIIDQIR
jgi:hypothetical protein